MTDLSRRGFLGFLAAAPLVPIVGAAPVRASGWSQGFWATERFTGGARALITVRGVSSATAAAASASAAAASTSSALAESTIALRAADLAIQAPGAVPEEGPGFPEQSPGPHPDDEA